MISLTYPFVLLVLFFFFVCFTILSLRQIESAESLGEYSPPNVQHHLSEAHLLLRAKVSVPVMS